MSKRSTVAALILVIGAGAIGYFAGGRQSGPDAKPAQAEAKSQNELKFPEGSPQLSALKVEAAVEAPLPLAEPLNGKV